MQKKITFFLFTLLMISGITISQDKQDWKFINPAPQSNLLRKIKMISETEWVAVGANGTFMHTSNSGANWYFHHFAGRVNPTTYATTQAYDVWFHNSNSGIIAGDQGYIGRTVDGGITIDSINTITGGIGATNTRNWSVWFADANTGYIGSGAQTALTTRILKTTDGGATWSLVYSDLSGSTSYLTSLGGADANTVIATWQNGTMLRSTNGGTNWTLTPGTFSSSVNNVSFLNSTTGFTCGGIGTVSRTTDAGVTWTPVNTTYPESLFEIEVVSASEIYAIASPSILYKSTDLGTTWLELPISVSGPVATFIWYSLEHEGSTYILSGDYGVVAKSTDGCATWSSNSVNYGSQLMYDIKNVPGTSKYWTVGRPFPSGSTTREILYSSNSGSNWVTRDLGVTGDFFAISMINENTGYVSGQNNQVLKTIDGGLTWTPKTGPSPVSTSQLYSMEFTDVNTGIVFVNFSTVSGGNVFRTTNGGDNWIQSSTGAPSENIYSADMVDANTGYCTMNSSGRSVYKTTNGGATWDSLRTRTAGFTSNVKSVSAPNANTVWICQSGGTNRVGKSTNGGTNWTAYTMPVVADFTSVYFINDNTGYVTGNLTTSVCKTTNGGINWTVQNTHGITNLKIYATAGDTAWILGGNQNVIRHTGNSNSLVKLNLTVLMEGMYNTSTNNLARKDTVKVYLRSANAPYSIKDSAMALIDTVTHSAQVTFPKAVSGTYYIVVKHFNTTETWSKSGGETILAKEGYYDYNFTSTSTQAYGNNMIQIGTKWCMYSGELNNDGVIDGADISPIDNDSYAFATGYLVTDLDASGMVDGTDLAIASNNAANFIGVIRP